MSRIDRTDAVCDRWMNYVTYSSEASLPPEFQKHMKTCAVCREEWQQLQIVWEALALDADPCEVPESLKSEVMNSIFAENSADTGAAAVPASASAPLLRRWLRRRGYAAAAAAACALLVVGLGVRFVLLPLRNHAAPAIISPSQTVLQEWSLVPSQQTMPAAKASIQLVRDGDVQKVVVQAEGLAPTSGEQAYQVWLIHDGRRYNCGTFRVDKSGKGVLVYDLKRPDVKIDGFGVTLEPDAQGSTPRGTKVLGTTNTF
jgi:hypothetical protein